MKRKDSRLSLLYCLMALLLLPLSLHAVTVRFITGMWGVDSQGNVAPAYIPFGESHEESLPTCVLEASGLPDDERIIHDYTDDTFAWTCGPIGGAGSTATILTGETAAPNTITQPGSYTLTFTGYTQYYIQKNINGAPVLEGPFTATLEPANEHYSLSRPVKVVEVVSIQGHGKMSTRNAVPQQRSNGTDNDERRNDSSSGTQLRLPVNREGGTLWENVPWFDSEIIYAQPGAKIHLTATLNPPTQLDASQAHLITWFFPGTVEGDMDNPLDITLTPQSFGDSLVLVLLGSTLKIMKISCVPMAVHAVVFGNDIPIKQDTTGREYKYIGPAWMDDDMDGYSDLEGQNADTSKKYQPVAYCSTDYLQATAIFKPCWKKCDGTLLQENEYNARADRISVNYSIAASNFSYIPPVDYSAGGTTVDGYEFSSVPYVAHYPNWGITWYIGFGENGNTDDNFAWWNSSSLHELYLTYNGHASSYETVFHIGCTQANNDTQEAGIFNNIWNYFSGLQVKRKDNTLLTYYHSFLTTVYDYENLIMNTDGQCGAWAKLLREVVLTQIPNINILYRIVVPKINAEGFIVKKWTFIGNGTSGIINYPYQNASEGILNFRQPFFYLWGIPCEVSYTEGTPGQNNRYPASLFNNHQMLQYNNICYDPSYGCHHTSFQSIDNTLSGYFQTQALGTIILKHYFMMNPDGNQITFY